MALKPNYVAEILEWVEAVDTDEERIKILKDNNSIALRDVLKLWFDKKIKLDLPEGDAPYTPCKPHNAPSSLFKQTPVLARCLETYNSPKMNKEKIFLGVLESIHPKDAELLLYVKDRKYTKKYSRTIVTLVNKAFPGLI